MFVKACRALGLACLCLGAFAPPAWPAVDAELLQRLRQEALAQDLATARTWQVLLRYRPVAGEWRSLVDDAAYFVSPGGKTDPHGELGAALEALLQPASLGNAHFQCRFPARSAWLIEELAIAAVVPIPACDRLQEALATIRPESAVLVFPAAHNNGPASMFGHTLLRVGSTHENELLSHAINYAAHSTDTNGLIYAFKGLFGYYSGYFTVLPYYEKLNEYQNMEHRDVWEYRLNLTEDEVLRLVLHSWEQQEIASDYYFFDENCSFLLLFLLEAARPEMRLAEHYWQRRSFWVIPVDTIATIQRAGLVAEARYRPAQATLIRYRASLLSESAQIAAKELALGKRSPGEGIADEDIETHRQIVDLAAEYLRYRYSRQELAAEEYRERYLTLLRERSRLGKGSEIFEDFPVPERPENGHGASRVTAGGGWQQDRYFLEFTWRPAYHDLLDPDEGYTPGAQINFLATAGRIYPSERALRLESLRLVDIVSLAARDRFFKPISWKVSGGLFRKYDQDADRPLFLGVNTGGGLAWEASTGSLFYLLAEADVHGNDRWQRKVALGGGGSLGLLQSLTPNLKGHLAAKAMTYSLTRHDQYRVTAATNYRLARDLGVLLKGEWEKTFDRSHVEFSLSLSRYF